jgi:hypothetical protein
MAYRINSRALDSVRLERSGPATLEDVLGAVRQSETLTDRQRQDISSGLRTLSKVINRPLCNLPCDVQSVRRRLTSVKPALHGISRGRWANIRSLVNKGLDIAGVERRKGGDRSPVSAAWAAFLAPLPARPLRVAITPFARYCTGLVIDPAQVTQTTFDDYGSYLEEFCSRTRPRETLLDLRRAWNCAGDQNYPAWPAIRFAVEDRRPRHSRPWSDFPATLKGDVDDMLKAATRRITLTGQKPIRPISAKARENLLRAHASAVVASGRDPSSLKNISDLVEIETAAAGLEHILIRVGGKTSVHVHQIAKLVCTLARRWVKVPKPHQEQLEVIRKQLDPGRHGMTEKNRATLRMFEDPDVVGRFDTLVARVWSKAPPPQDMKMADAVRLQIALAVELLTFAPVRVKSLASVNIDRNIIDQGHGRHRSVHLFFGKSDVKNGVELEFQLQASTIALLDRYLRDVRPRLLRAPSPWLFPGEGVVHKCSSLLSQQIADLIETDVGVRVTAHQFRHLAGYLFLKANPGAHEIVRQLLGHRSIDTTLRFYAGMEAAEAVRHFDRHVEQRRAEARPTRPRRRGRHA